jgi:uncharacterized protein
MPLLMHVLYEIAAGHLDERPRYAQPIAPPPGITLKTLQPGLLLEGRVVRSLPFGVFVDVGLGTEALIPTAHIGDHPGADAASVAPVGAVVQARVLEVEPEKKRLTLTMRSGRGLWDRPAARGPQGPRGPGRGGDRREGQGGRGPSGDRPHA